MKLGVVEDDMDDEHMMIMRVMMMDMLEVTINEDTTRTNTPFYYTFSMASEIRFEEKILYKTRQHWIIPLIASIKLLILIILPTTIIIWFMSDFSLAITGVWFFILSGSILWYEHYLWHHSWLLIGNQKVTLSIRNGIFSQYATNVRYRNIRDSAVSKNSMLGFFLKYGSLFIRSSAAEGDFTAKYVPKVGKIYALVNALSRYSDDERSHIDSIEKLHSYHTRQEFSPQKIKENMTTEIAISLIKTLPGIVDAIELSHDSRKYIHLHEEKRNSGITETLKRDCIVCFIHNSDFRDPVESLVRKDHLWVIEFPGIPFPEIVWVWVISSSPSAPIHDYLLQFFPYANPGDATVLVGWDKEDL
jgi:hypothetical protein